MSNRECIKLDEDEDIRRNLEWYVVVQWIHQLTTLLPLLPHKSPCRHYTAPQPQSHSPLTCYNPPETAVAAAAAGGVTRYTHLLTGADTVPGHPPSPPAPATATLRPTAGHNQSSVPVDPTSLSGHGARPADWLGGDALGGRHAQGGAQH